MQKNIKKRKIPIFSQDFSLQNYLSHPQPQQFERINNQRIVLQSTLIPPLKPQPHPQFCKSKSKKMIEQQSIPPLQSLPTSPQFEPPKKFICASYISYVRLLFVLKHLHINILLKSYKKCSQTKKRSIKPLLFCFFLVSLLLALIFLFLFLTHSLPLQT